MNSRYSTSLDQWEAVKRRDKGADGTFFYAVRTTGVYCYPSCSARTPLERNVLFFPTRTLARAAGYRACLRCKSDLPPKNEREATLVAQACRILESAEAPPSLTDLANQVGLSPHHFHRTFKKVTGVTPKHYGDAHRNERVQLGLAEGKAVTTALYDAGYNSPSPFYSSADDTLGMKPKTYRAGGEGETIAYSISACCLGFVLVAVSSKGVCAILLGDSHAELLQDLKGRFARANLQRDEAVLGDILKTVTAIVDNPMADIPADFPLDIRGTAFQRKIWNALRQIPQGTTVSYADVAAQVGSPSSSRAVAGACAANHLAVIVPCHRVRKTGGELSGYRWGVDRKRKLLEAEAGK